MNFALGYLLHRFFFRFADFFHHWYVDGSRIFFHHLLAFFERLDRVFAVGINLRYFFHPLYKDYSIIGRFVGVIFRALRILLGIVFYSIFLGMFLILYLAWLSIPAVIIFMIWKGIASYGI